MKEEDQVKRLQTKIIDLNKNGLSYLTNNQFGSALQYFRQAQKAIIQELKINSKDMIINKLAGITYNNLACYYKKNNKPKVALSYLKKALQIQFQKISDLISSASTHLNICAIYSFIKKHHQAAEHANLAIQLLQRVKNQIQSSNKQPIKLQKGYYNVSTLAHYNYAIQLEHLKIYQQSKKNYAKAIELGKLNSKQNQGIINQSQQSIIRVQSQIKTHHKKLVDLINKKQLNQLKGNSEFMRKNKKNIRKSNEQWNMGTLKKYELYVDTSRRYDSKNYASVDKIKKLEPLTLPNMNSKVVIKKQLTPKNND